MVEYLKKATKTARTDATDVRNTVMGMLDEIEAKGDEAGAKAKRAEAEGLRSEAKLKVFQEGGTFGVAIDAVKESKFFKAVKEEVAPTIHGDGEQSRDFTYVANAVHANLLALFVDHPDAVNQVYNIACGEQTTLNELWKMIKKITKSDLVAQYGSKRPGDVKHSLADINKAKEILGYENKTNVAKGLQLIL